MLERHPRRGEAELVTDERHHPRRLGRRREVAGLGSIRRERLLDEHVTAGGDGLLGELDVAGRWRGDDHDVGARQGQRLGQ